MIHLQFQKVPWHSFEVAFLEVYAPLHPNPPLPEAMAVLWSRYGPPLWIDSFGQVLDPRNGFPAILDFIFGKSQYSMEPRRLGMMGVSSKWHHQNTVLGHLVRNPASICDRLAPFPPYALMSTDEGPILQTSWTNQAVHVRWHVDFHSSPKL